MELVVLSGKGGTGKTTIATALSELAEEVVRIDCDVDAPNFYLYYEGRAIEKEDFYGGKKAFINEEKCIKCGKCEAVCRFNAISNCIINSFSCEGCGACSLICPQNAIELKDEKTANTFITEINKGMGIISGAEMEIGADGSGKLITFLRKNGRKFSNEEKLIISDGSPGIGCPVIASITGCDVALVVTEPTKSGLEDLMRVVSLCKHFGIYTMVCVNKYDINEEISEEIEKFVDEQQLKLIGKIPYDDTAMKSINELKPIIYYDDSTASKAIKDMWINIKKIIF
ncbi:(4Fe-4S)-binding protein [Clostridium polyendosporum]|uniref:(4Fe-4S)-binding protein n=1 Tax=Clostridium polyendosporum TaxID=69208 RepID=A0A919RZA9_9CLOT|nr:ATP-binding protein [Clostridium polyendosporum]GIM29091.1 (4Fe-4S)-binding protein [Clostridium polyendosporum]